MKEKTQIVPSSPRSWTKMSRMTVYNFICKNKISAIQVGNQWKFKKPNIDFALGKQINKYTGKTNE